MNNNEVSRAVPECLKDHRRLYDRFPSRFPTKFKDARQDFGSNVFLRNISAQGARVTTKDQVYLNDSVALEVELSDGKEPMLLRGEVVWTTPVDVELWDAGIKFHKVVLMDLWRIFKRIESGLER